MKKYLHSIATVILTVMFAFTLNITSFAADKVDFDEMISSFSSTSLNTFELEIGETHTSTSSIWLSSGGSAESSDDSIVTVSENGTVTAVSEGTAYVVITSGQGLQSMYRYDVVPVSAEDFDAAQNNNSITDNINDYFEDKLEAEVSENTETESNSIVENQINVMIIVGVIFFVIFIFAFVSSLSSVAGINKIKLTLGRLSANPCQSTADEFLKALKVNFMQRYIISHSHEYNGGISKRDCVEVFTNIVLPSPEIDEDTKTQIQERMIAIGCIFTRPLN